MGKRRPIRLLAMPGLKEDLHALQDAAVNTPRGPEGRLLRVALNELELIAQGARGTHPLEYMPTYPDLSDCETTYVGSDPNRKPSHRLVWRERMPESPDQPITREIIALGERNAGQAYYLAGQRLGRPVGLTLAALRAQREPIATPLRSRQQSIDVSQSSAESDLEFN
jgi:hypothetical protein